MDLLTDHLAEARGAHQRGDWSASHAAFVRADGVGPMAVDDVEAFAVAAWRLGHASEAVRLSERVYGQLVRTDPAAASMKALDVALQWLTRGDANVGRAWLDRARRLLAGDPVGPTNGYLAYLEATVAVRDGDTAARQATATVVGDLCASLDDPALTVLSSIVVALGALSEGRTDAVDELTDRALPAVESGKVGLEWAGDVYGLLLHASRGRADAPRLRRWTDSMARWCESHDAVLYHRVLRVYRTASEHELLTESSALEGVHALAAGEGFHRIGEMRRRRGDVGGARDAFARAQRLGVSAPTDIP
jgi:hypothetical protein